MPLKKIGHYKVIESDDGYREKYWPLLSKYIQDKYGDQEIRQSNKVQEILKDCFTYLSNEFKTLLSQNLKASFFICVQDIHEDSIEILTQRLKGNEIPINEEDFAGTRRIMKCILEQGCTLDLVGHPFFYKEICENASIYIKHLEELLYLGQRAFEITEYITRSLLCPHSIGVHVQNNELTTYIYPPFNSLFAFIFDDYKRHANKVVVSDSIHEFKRILKDDLKINLDEISRFVGDQLKDKKYRFGVTKLDTLINELHSSLGYSKNTLNEFYSGLIVHRGNVMSFEECLLKTQNENRYMYRPILEYTIDDIKYLMCGANKWAESLTQLTTNCFPFGQFPKEWKELPELKNFIVRIMNTHDKVLENPAIEIIEKANLKFDRNITFLQKSNNRNISLIKANLGEIDLIFLDEQESIIYIVECKHNRSRYEYHSWKRDIDNFRKTYEKQLNNKCAWIKTNKIDLLEHFEFRYNYKIEHKENYSVTPLFLINAPTLYMYDSDFLVVTLHELELLLQGKHITVQFNGELKGKQISFQNPYFKSAENLFA